MTASASSAVAARGVPPAFAEYLRASRAADPGRRRWRASLRGERVVHIADVADDDVYRTGDPARERWSSSAVPAPLLAVALRKDDALLGVI